MSFERKDREVIEEQGHTLAGAERIYLEYQQARDNGESHDKIHAEGWCGDLIDIFSDRYYQAQKEYERGMAEYRASVFGTGLTMHERELESLPR